MMDIMYDNMLIKEIRYKHNSNVDAGLLNILTPNEFFIYTLLVNAPNDFIPSYDKLRKALKVGSKQTVFQAVNRLRELGLVHIEHMGNRIFTWFVRDVELEQPEVDFEVIEEVKVEVPQRNEREEILKEIKKLEDELNYVELAKSGDIMAKITELKAKLKRGNKK